MADETKNAKIQIEDRFNSQLGPTTTLQFDQTDFDTTGITEWIRLINLGYAPQETPQQTRRENWLVEFGCFAKTGPGGENTHRIWELADAVRAAFDDLVLSVVDWTQGPTGPQVATLIFAIPTVDRIPPRPELKEAQHLVVTYRPILWA